MAATSKAIDKQSLRGLSPLGKLTPDKIDDIISKSRVDNLPAGRTIFRQGEDNGHTIYLLSGQIELSTAGKSRKQIIKGKSIDAKFPIADQVPRPVTARTKTASTLLYIDSSLLEILLDENPSGEYEVTEIEVANHSTDWMMRFLQSPAFLKLPTENIQKVLMSMEEVHVKKDQVIIEQGIEGDYYYIIRQGCCLVTRQPSAKAQEVRLAKLVEGDGFGEESLINNAKRNASVRMLENGILMRLKKDDFISLLITPLIRKVHLNSLKSSLYAQSVILDIRTNSEYSQGSIDKAINIPFTMIRLRIPTLDSKKQYLIYAENKDDARTAAFLLAQHTIDCLIISGSLRDGQALSGKNVTLDRATNQNAVESTPRIKEAPNSILKQDKTVESTTTIEHSPVKTKSTGQATDTSDQESNRERHDHAQVAQTSTNAENEKYAAELEKLRQEAKQQIEQMLAEAEAIKQSAIQDAHRLRNKIEQEETLKLRTELENTRSRAETAIKKSEQLAEQIRQQAEQEGSQIREQAMSEAAKLREELAMLQAQETQMKQALEAELLATRQKMAEKAQREAEEARIAAEQAAVDARNLALREAEETRAMAHQEAQEAIIEAEKARQAALHEAEETRKAAEQAAADAKALAEQLTQQALIAEQAAAEAREKARQEAEQARLQAQQEAEAIKQAAHDEANRIKSTALQESKKLKASEKSKPGTLISHEDVFNLEDVLSPTIAAVQPYAEEASLALKMAEEIKAKLIEADEKRIKNEQQSRVKAEKHKVEIKKLDGKLILESANDVFIFKEPKKTAPPQNKNIQFDQGHTKSLADKDQTTFSLNQLPAGDDKTENRNILEFPVIPPYHVDEPETKKTKKSFLAVSFSVLLIVVLGLVAYTTKIQINFTEVGALANQNSLESEELRVKDQARKDFRRKISSISRK